MDWFMGKSRRKDREAPTTPPSLDSELKHYLEDDFVQERFLDVDFLTLVTIPYGIDNSEWLATHTKSFFEHVNLMYGCLSDYCQPTVCSAMSGPNNIQYQWLDDRGKKCKCTAPQYIDYVMSFSQKCIYDETVFPTKYGNVFPSSFEATAKKISRLLLHVFAHIYSSHSHDVQLLKLHGHLNTVYYHFHLFNRQFALVDDKEMEVLDDLFERLHHHATRKVLFDPSAVPTDTAAPASPSSPLGSPVDGGPPTSYDDANVISGARFPAAGDSKDNIVETSLPGPPSGYTPPPTLTLVM